MKIRSFALLVVLVTLATFAGCQKATIYEGAILELSTKILDFKNTGGNTDVSVITDQEEWIVDTSASWINPMRDGSSIKVVVEPNQENKTRQGRISVHAGDRHAQILVKQDAAEILLKAQVSEVKFDKNGGEKSIQFASNSKEVKVELDDAAKEWVTMDYIPGTYNITLTATANTETSPRVGKVYLKASLTDLIEVSLEQMGNAKYILPFLDKTSTRFSQVHKFEIARGAYMAYMPGVIVGNEINPFYIYSSDSECFTQVNYLIRGHKDDFYDLAVLIAKDAKSLKEPSFESFMKQHGFEKRVVKDEIQFHHKEYPYVASIDIDESRQIFNLVFAYEPKQPRPQETFKALPMKEKIDWLQFKDEKKVGKTFAEVKTYFTALGLEISEPDKASGYSRVNFPENPETLLLEGYWFRQKKFKEDEYTNRLYYMRAVYKNTDAAFYLGNEKPCLTNEIHDLMKNEGFIYIGKSEDELFEQFANPTTNTQYDFSYASIKGVENGAPVLDIRVSRKDLSKYKSTADLTPLRHNYPKTYPIIKAKK